MGERVLTVTAAGLEVARGNNAATPSRRIYGTTELNRNQATIVRAEEVGQFSQAIGPESVVLGNIEAGGIHTEDVTYEDLPWWLLLALKGGVTPTGAAGTGYTWLFDPSESVDDLKSASFFQQDGTQAWKMPFGMVDEFNISGAVGAPWTSRATLIGADLERISAFTTPAARTGRQTARMGQASLYIGAAGAEPVSGDVKTGMFIDFSLTIRNSIRRKYFGEEWDGMAGVGREHREIECDFTFEETLTSLDEFTHYSGSTPRVVKISAKGPVIEGTGPAVNRRIDLIMPGMWETWTLGSRVSNRIFTMRLRGIYDVTYGKQFRARVLNGVAAV